ncbi:MAG: hypothetical protein KF812_09360 [Fimbriimonadaceae bacterium]|nr:hypothetical protein [Fimbriimonadaceae bacterium]
MILSLVLVLISVQSPIESESLAFGSRLRHEFAITRFDRTEFAGTSDGINPYGWSVSRSRGFNGQEMWNVSWSTSGYVSFRYIREDVYLRQSIFTVRSQAVPQDEDALSKFNKAVDADLEWHIDLLEMPYPLAFGMRLSASWNGKPVLSKRLDGQVFWERSSGQYISAGAQLHRPRSVINEGEPMPLEAAETRAQILYLKQPGDNPVFTSGKLKLGWSVENEAGAARLIYLHERMLESHPIRFAFDAVTGIEVTAPPLR